MYMTTPSGRIFGESDIEFLQKAFEYGFIQFKETPFRLKSGIESHVYVFGREDITDHSDFEWIIGRSIHRHLAQIENYGRRRCLIGIPTAGSVLAQAAATLSYHVKGINSKLSHRTMREVKKQYGAHQTWINGAPNAAHEYWLVDNVITDGKSKIEANQKLIEDGYPAFPPCLVLIDRQQGGVQRLLEAGFPRVEVLYNLLDVTFAFGEMDLWPKSAVNAVQQEIEQHNKKQHS